MSTNSPLIPRSTMHHAPNHALPNSMPTTTLELREVFSILRRRKGVILAGVLLGVSIAFVMALTAPKQFSATATIEVNKESGSALGLDDLSGTSSEVSTSDQVNTDLLTHQAVIMSDNIALNVIKRLHLDTMPPYAPAADDSRPAQQANDHALDISPQQRDRMLRMFHSGLSVKLVKGTRLMDVTFKDSQPRRSADIANTVIDSFISQYAEARYQASSKASSWLASQLADLKNKVNESQAKVDEYQRESGLAGMTMSSVGGPSGQTPTVTSSSNNVPLERLVELNRDLTSADISRISREAIFKMTETQDPDVVLGIGSSPLAGDSGSDSVLSSGSSDLALLQQLRQQEAQLKVQIAAAATKYGSKNPAMVQLQNEETAQNEQIHTELLRIRSRAKNDLDVAAMAENSIQARIAAQESEVNKVSVKADQLLLLQQEALSSRQLYRDLYAKLEEASIASGVRASNITLVNPARIPSTPSSPKRAMMVQLGGVAGLLFGLVAAFVLDYFDDSINTLEHLETLTTIPAIGLIPNFRNQLQLAPKQKSYVTPLTFLVATAQRSFNKSKLSPEPGAWLIYEPHSQVAEAYRTLRTALTMSKAEQPPKVILVVSGSPQEGKSTTCFNTAMAFAVQGSRVLYLDADLRRPTKLTTFECAHEAGLTNYLTSTRTVAEVIHQSPAINTLFIAPAGPAAPNPSELIGSRRFANMITELKSQFDYVFIDTPPLLLVSDSQLLSSHADGYLLVLRAEQTTKRLFRRTLSAVTWWKSPPLGVVLNGVNTQSSEYGMYGYYQSQRSAYASKAS